MRFQLKDLRRNPKVIADMIEAEHYDIEIQGLPANMQGEKIKNNDQKLELQPHFWLLKKQTTSQLFTHNNFFSSSVISSHG